MISKATLRKTTPTGTGTTVGQARFVDTPEGLAVRIEVKGLAPGEYGMHLHEHDSCGPGWSEADKATIPAGAAGPHYDPRRTGKHLGPGAQGHAGDLPRLIVKRPGVTVQDVMIKGLTAMDVSGRTLIIHEGGDNYSDKPRPNGGAGGRQICGSIVLGVSGSRYPGVTSARLASTSTVEHTVLTEQRPYLCVSYDTEQAAVQPLRLAAGLVGAPIVGYGAWTLRKERPVLAAGLATVAVGMGAWSLYVWDKANTEMKRGPR